MAEQVEAGYLKDITEQAEAEVANIGGAAAGWQVDGKQYGLPFPWASRASGTTRRCSSRPASRRPPTTFDELNAAVTKLKAIVIEPDRRRRR